MEKIAVIYKSKYGATKQYAQWIAQALDAPIFEASKVKPSELLSYDAVVYGGGLYAGGIAGVELVTKNPCNSLIVFTVGLSNPDRTDYSAILNKNFSSEMLAKTKVFHLRGAIDYTQLGLVHKGMMAMMKKTISGKNEAKMTDEDRGFLETYGRKVSFMDESAITPIIEYIKEMKL